MAYRNERRRMGVGLAGCLVAGSLGGALLAAGLAGGIGGGAVAGADTTPGYLLTCDLGTTPLPIPGAITTGRLPKSVAAGKTFKLANYGITITLPSSGAFAAAAGYTVSGTYTTGLSATGATPASRSTVFTIPSQTFPNPLPSQGVPLSAKATPGPFKAKGKAGKAVVSTSATSTLVVNLTPPATTSSVPVTLTCTEPVVPIASTTVKAARRGK